MPIQKLYASKNLAGINLDVSESRSARGLIYLNTQAQMPRKATSAVQSLFSRFSGVLKLLLVVLCAGGFLSADIVKAADSSDIELQICKDAHNDLKTKFQKTKKAVDYTVDKFKRFNAAAKGWRTAATRRNQKENIKGINAVMDSVNEDALKAALTKVLGEEMVGYIEDAEKLFGLKLSDRINLWQTFAKDPRKAYDYMYDLSAIDRKLRDSGVYRKMESVQKTFNKAGAYITKAGDMLSFVELFDPNQVNPDSPTSSLKAIGNVLEEIKTVSDKIPGLGHLIGFYIEATHAFSGALDRLDKKLVEARQGAMCGQLGRFSIIKPAFESDCPDCDCLTFLSINDEYPLLKPAKGWEDTETSDCYIFIDANRSSMVDKRDFDLLYRAFAALSRKKATRGIVDKELFYAYLISAGNKFQTSGRGKGTMAGLSKEMEEIYSKISGPETTSRFIKVLRKVGELPENTHEIVSSSGARYSLWRRDKMLFDGLYVFDSGFRKKIKSLASTYADKGIGTIKLQFPAEDKPLEPGMVQISVNGETMSRLSSKSNGHFLSSEILVPWSVFTQVTVKIKGYQNRSLKWRFNALSNQAVIQVVKVGADDSKEEPEPEPEHEPADKKETQTPKEEPQQSGEVSVRAAEIEQAWKAGDWKTLIAIQKDLVKKNKIDAVRQINTHLAAISDQKGNWFEKDVGHYLRSWERASYNKYSELERTITQKIMEQKGNREDLERCMEPPEKEADALRQQIRLAKKEHPALLDTLFKSQGNPGRILELIDDFVAKYKIPENLAVSVHYTSPCSTGTIEKKAEALTLQLKGGDQSAISVRDTLAIDAFVTGGKKPVKVQWEGENISAAGLTAVFAASNPGSYTIRATATDAAGSTASDAVTVYVASQVEGVLRGVPGRVTYGSTIPVRIDVKDDAGAAPDSRGGYTYIWMADKEGIELDPPSSSHPTVKVTFGNVGRVNLWAQIIRDDKTAGEAKPVALSVTPPKITLQFIPEKPFICQETRAVLKISPKLPEHLIDFRWFPPGPNARELGEQENGRTYIFSPKSTLPVAIKVLARTPYYGETLKEIRATVSGTPYTVEVAVSRTAGPPPMVWDGEKLVEARGQIAVHQNMKFTASVIPKPADEKIRYAWSLNPDSHFAGGETGQSIVANRSQTGACTATVNILDKDGTVLGKGSGSFEVTISQDQLTKKGDNNKKDNAKAENNLTLEKTVFKPGEAISLAFTSAEKYPGRSWVGLFPAGAPHTKATIADAFDLQKRYLKQKTGGALPFKAPAKAGRYEFRMFEKSNGREVTALKFEVKE